MLLMVLENTIFHDLDYYFMKINLPGKFDNIGSTLEIRIELKRYFFTVSKYCGSGLKIDLVVVVVVVVIKLLSNSSPFVKV